MAGPSSVSDELTFGLPPSLFDERHRDLPQALARFLATRIGKRVAPCPAVSYDDLSNRMASGELDAAWLPPALFVELDRTIGLRPVAAAERGGGIGYYASFFTHRDSHVASLDALRGCSVGWVDPGSASGYVFPRLQLASLGIDPTEAFQEEVFFRSHEAVVRAVVDRAVDVGATFVHVDPREPRKILRAGWMPGPDDVDTTLVKPLDAFGPLPADVIATALSEPESLADRLGDAFLEVHTVPEVERAARRHFGTGRFMPVNPGAYEGLRRAMDMAEGSGVEVVASLRPSLLV
ncbi:MAG: phosphate/phosphite/phosphonate ABC transporter substrate-binding protein [Myxococcota bacterium]